MAEDTMFLHVFHVADENITSMAPVKIKQNGAVIMLDIGGGIRTWKVSLSTSGIPGGEVTAPGEKKATHLAKDLEADAQYKQWEDAVGVGGAKNKP